MHSRPFIHHAVTLCLCSVVSFVGHYMQFGVARLTPWIPASAGLLLGLVASAEPLTRWRKWTAVTITTTFGLLTAYMSLRFWPREFQPLRKKLVFTVMSASAAACLARVSLNRVGASNKPTSIYR